MHSDTETIDALFHTDSPFRPALERAEMLDTLQQSIRDLRRQDSNEGRVTYVTEAKTLMSVMRRASMLDAATDACYRAIVLNEHRNAIERCRAAGEAVDPHVADRVDFQLAQLVTDGFPPQQDFPQ
ncbi:hypothetical protein [Pseudomonas syringae]|uniref:hypothetical protein n=1 Tax=Pseudomonas syringae TaxID=317 RepID=UPI002463428E|nr:hypothetical protein [Pseudomonas syringae]MDH4602369.1 hypothetical protein [Pseudomonas syringae pv. papulans]